MTPLNEDPLLERTYATIQLLTPIALIMALLIINATTSPLTPSLALKAPLFMIAIYYWSTFYPPLMPSWLCFSAGLILDIITLTPLGTQALIFTGLKKVTLSQRAYLVNQPFTIYWLIFGLFYAVALAITATFTHSQALNTLLEAPHATITGFTANLCLFPAIYTLLHASHKVILAQPPSPLEKKRRKILHRKSKSRKAALRS